MDSNWFPEDEVEEAARQETDSPMDVKREYDNSFMIKVYCLCFSVAFFIASPIAAAVTGEWGSMLGDWLKILLSPSLLVTDYYSLGGLGSAFFNAGMCGMACTLIMMGSRSRATSVTLAGYFLVVAHCFYGLNFLNMWPCFFGVVVYCAVRNEDLGERLHLAMFATSLAPFVSELLFRYTLGSSFVLGEVHVTLMGICLALNVGIIAGFLIPALLPGTAKMHRGLNLYKAGLAIGLLGCFIYALMYKTAGIEAPSPVVVDNATYNSYGRSYSLFVNSFFVICFAVSIIFGYLLNGKSFNGYSALLSSSGHDNDFATDFGMPLCFINIGLYGLFVLAYMNIVTRFTTGAGFTGPTTGVIIAAITFSAAGQHPRNVWPIMAGYGLLFAVQFGAYSLLGRDPAWTLSTQGYINGLAFATGLCPISGKFGWKYGMVAGFLDAILCTSTSAMHGGFVLYNGGFTAGLTALLLLPILEYYEVPERDG